MKLGRKAIKHDSRTLRLARYLTDELPKAPTALNWTRGITNFGMMLNDQLGDCTCAAICHALQVWTANTGKELTEPDSEVLALYEWLCGYNPADPSTDQGGIELDCLTQWKKHSVKGHHLLAFASVSPSNVEEVRQAMNLFGGVYIGVALPVTAQRQVGEVWDVVGDGITGDSAPGSWGGHAVFVPNYDPHHLYCITWGRLQPMTEAFWKAYVDESYALLGKDWITAKGSPQGFALQTLLHDLSGIR